MNGLVQYIVINGKILDLGWNKGAVIAQACHASVAVMARFKNDPDVQEYTSPENLEHMTKVVLKASEAEFDKLISTLEENKVDHWAWREQPDNIISAAALKPCLKDQVVDLLHHLKLYR